MILRRLTWMDLTWQFICLRATIIECMPPALEHFCVPSMFQANYSPLTKIPPNMFEIYLVATNVWYANSNLRKWESFVGICGSYFGGWDRDGLGRWGAIRLWLCSRAQLFKKELELLEGRWHFHKCMPIWYTISPVIDQMHIESFTLNCHSI